MATARFHPKAVAVAAAAKMEQATVDKEAAKAAALERFRRVTHTEGWLWWKTTRTVTEAEAQTRYRTGYWPWSDPMWFGGMERRNIEDRYANTVRRAELLGDLALRAMRQVYDNPITLDEDEADFLRLEPLETPY